MAPGLFTGDASPGQKLHAGGMDGPSGAGTVTPIFGIGSVLWTIGDV